MKASKILLLSLVLNAVTVSAIVYLAKPKQASPDPSNTATAGANKAADSTKTRPVSRREKAGSMPKPAGEDSAFNWGRVESQDYKKYIANLRVIGCPEETIKDIIIADVNKLYASRISALRSPAKDYKFWQADQPWGGAQDKDKQKQARTLEKEKRALIQELLGVDIEEESRKLYGGNDFYERSFGFIPKEKREQVRTVQESYSEMEQEIYRKAGGFIDGDTQLELRKIAKARSAELAKILTPEELEQYELRSSNTANQMRWGLKSFDPTEEEFRSVFKLRKTFEDELGQLNVYDPDETPEIRKKRAEAQKLLEESIKTQLGEARYSEYNRSQDYSYQELARIADRYELPKDTASKIYDMKKEAEDTAQKLRNDKTLSNEQRQAALRSIQTETEKAITTTLGDKAVKNYKRSGGWWINGLGSGGQTTFTTTTGTTVISN